MTFATVLLIVVVAAFAARSIKDWESNPDREPVRSRADYFVGPK